ncbi:MAG: pantetheine-phosphate adenylyltransferase [Gammaproteobacteria bacterium]|nr:pantetheine-phosphate adenylyltransferase [Gammaproteobacteria bacterium]
MTVVALYPGTFDPITHGHTDILTRAVRLFDEVVIGIAENVDKRPLFSLDERIHLASQVTSGLDGVRVVGFNDLLVDCASREGAKVILRGLRAVSDFEYEFQMAAMNRNLNADIETVFMTPLENHTFISASLVKEIARLGGNVSKFLHPQVVAAVAEKIG